MLSTKIPSHYRELKHEVLSRFLPDRKVLNVLDLGSGAGATTRALKNVLAEKVALISLDNDLESLKLCIGSRILSDGSRLPLKDDSMDVIIAFDVIEHIESDVDLLKEAHRTLNQEGLLFISTPRENQPLNFISNIAPKLDNVDKYMGRLKLIFLFHTP